MAHSDSALPLMATASDLREIVKFLRKKPEGVGIVEAMEVSKKQTLDPRKIAAYEYWGIVHREKDRLRLSDFGMGIARQLQCDTRAFRYVLTRTELYRLTLDWIRLSSFDLVTHSDVADYWRNEFAETLSGKSEAIIKGNVISFFHLCHAAELGTVTIGKRGQPARMKVDQEELAEFLSSEMDEALSRDNVDDTVEAAADRAMFSALHLQSAGAPLRLLVIHRNSDRLAAQITQTLSLSGLESEIFIRDESALLPVNEIFSSALRRCQAGILILTADDYIEDENGHLTLRQNAMSEISALCMLYSGRVITLHETHLQMPEELAGLIAYQFTGQELSWETGLQLMQAVREIR